MSELDKKVLDILTNYAGRLGVDTNDYEIAKEYLPDLQALITERERVAYSQGRNAEIEILGYTEGCDCITCKEVKLKTDRLATLTKEKTE